MSQIRIWRLGSPEHNIMPGPKVIARLEEILKGWNGTDDIDLVWDWAITLEVFDLPSSHNKSVDVITSSEEK